MTTVDDVFYAGKPAKHLVSTNYYGLELEIEDITLPDGFSHSLWKTEADGSLRNNGVEFVSSPLILDTLDRVLEEFFALVPTTARSYSERTSIHVHCNMRGVELDSLKSMVLLYILFEEFFFGYVSPERKKNIFCVPLKDIQLSEKLVYDLYEHTTHIQNSGKGRSWEKYTALNLLPLVQYGTVEFRHMEGNKNIPYIVNWVKIIHALKQAALAWPFKALQERVKTLNTNSDYAGFTREVFKDLTDVLCKNAAYSDYKRLMYKAVMQAKLWNFREQKEAALRAKAEEKQVMKKSLVFPEKRIQRLARLHVEQRFALADIMNQITRENV